MMDLDPKNYPPKSFVFMVDQLKNFGLSSNEIENHDFQEKTNGKLSEIYEIYQERLNATPTNFLSFTAIKMELVNGRFVLFSEINLKDGFSKFSYITRAWFLRFSMYVFGVV